jgi:hypothetical protein
MFIVFVDLKVCLIIVDWPSIDEVNLCYEAVWTIQSTSIDGRLTMCGHTFSLTFLGTHQSNSLSSKYMRLMTSRNGNTPVAR